MDSPQPAARSFSRRTYDFYFARWGPPDSYEPGERLTWTDGGPLLVPDPVLLPNRWPGFPLGIWRVDTVLTGPRDGFAVRGDAFTIVERVPSWRWLGERGDELLALIEETVAFARAHLDQAVPEPPVATSWGEDSARIDFAGSRPEHAAAHFAWLVRERLLEVARKDDPASIDEQEDFGCGGPMCHVGLTGWWSVAERDAIEEARRHLGLARAKP